MESKLVLALEPLFLLLPVSGTPPLLPGPTFAHLPPPSIRVFVKVPCPHERPDFTCLANSSEQRARKRWRCSCQSSMCLYLPDHPSIGALCWDVLLCLDSCFERGWDDERGSVHLSLWCHEQISGEKEKPDCSKARCEVQFSPRCPEDSVLIEGYAPPGECCPLPSRCVCDPAGCLRKVCQPGYLNILVSKASGKPGECCDLYECKPGMHRCECLSGLCGFPVCEVGATARIVSRGDGTPGKCCDVFECVNETKPACVFNNVEYSDGDMFRMDNCRFCRCQGGVSICFTAQCGELSCERYYMPEGECCPVCEDPVYPLNNPAGCYANGQIHAHGDRWREDDCTFCQCINGEPHCVATACGQSCMNPVKVPGECCPVCEGEELCMGLKRGCTLNCPFGFLTDAYGCEICQCRPRPRKCRPVVCEKHCPFGYLKNKHGCDICRCKKCPELRCSKICSLGFQKDSHGCLICKCREVSASAGPPVLSGTCLSMDGHHHKNEESWHDGCRECYCHSGREMCALITCPVPACGNPTIRPGRCCPSCSGDFEVQKPELSTPSVCHAPGGEYFVEGETWHIDACTQCACHGGRVLCETEVCPPLLCQDPARTQDSCCPQCPDEPLQPSSSHNDSVPSYCKNDEGDIFLAAESWKPDVCTSCVCMDSVISCYSESCPSVSCERPVLRKGQCCPYCIEMYVPEPTNVPIEKTNHREIDMEVPLWPTPSENDIIHLPRDMGHPQIDYRDNTRLNSEDASVDSIASVVVPIVIGLSIIIAFLFINQKKQWIPLLCWYRTPTKPSSLNNQLVSVDCKKGTRVQVDGSQRMLRIAEPDARFSGFYSMQKQNHLQADNFYQTV
ncbi:hypothetical protein FD755_008053 [Muntiacus reevesi]|uniref:VWFC domain-containing protein n=1 Tax=Muntiacus reevesi TaxID=9886 RepID=A0A5J5MJF3_MUNRE|nr:hypothetical protein FD755_008053 [Muntiacus reevesi]